MNKKDSLYKFHIFLTSNPTLVVKLVILCIFCSQPLNAQICNGNLGSPIFLETFGTGIRADLNTTSSGTTTYCYEDGTATTTCGVVDSNIFMGCNEHTLYSGDPKDYNFYWVTGGDHTGDSNGMMAIFNADFTPNEFYRRSVDNICGGTTFEFAAWIANIYDPMDSPFPCIENNGDGLYPNVTFEIRHPITDSLIGDLATGNILPTSRPDLPDNIEWKQFGITFQMPIDINALNIIIRNNGEGGCGNDLAIDDITLRPCGPFTSIEAESIPSCSNRAIQLNALIGNGLVKPYISWQRWNASLEIWEDIGISGLFSDGFNQLLLSTTENNDQIRFVVAGDSLALLNTNCVTVSDTFIVQLTPQTVTIEPDTIYITLTANNNTICIIDEFNFLSGFDSISICQESNIFSYNIDLQEESACINFENVENPSILKGTLCIIFCDEAPCINCIEQKIIISSDENISLDNCNIPNGITPNGDNINDFFFIDCLEGLQNTCLKIYNRWGSQVYLNENYSNNWNGFYKGKPLPEGTYYYVLSYAYENNQSFNKAGSITLLR